MPDGVKYFSKPYNLLYVCIIFVSYLYHLKLSGLLQRDDLGDVGVQRLREGVNRRRSRILGLVEQVVQAAVGYAHGGGQLVVAEPLPRHSDFYLSDVDLHCAILLTIRAGVG